MELVNQLFDENIKRNYTKTDGNIILNGQHVDIKNSKMAKKLGIAMIHQELSSFPDLSVSANMFMGNEFAHGFWSMKRNAFPLHAMFEKIGSNWIRTKTERSECS